MGRGRKNQKLSTQIRNIVREESAPVLADISFRLGQLYEVGARATDKALGTVYAEDMNTLQHQLTGYTVTANSPTAGSIAWTDVHVVYNGVDYSCVNGNTALKYVYFTLATTPTTLKFSADKPTLAEGDILLFINEGGTPRNVLSMTNQTLPRVVATNAIDNDALAANAVEGGNIKDNAVTSTKVAAGAISRADQITGKIVGTGVMVAGAVDSTILGDNAVTNLKLANGAVNRTEQIVGKIVNTGQLANNAVDGTILATGAINNVNKFGAGKIIPGAQIVDTSVGSAALGNAAVLPSKLNILQHVMY